MHLCSHIARVDAHDCDAVISQLVGQCQGRQFQRGFTGSVSPPTRIASYGSVAGNINNHSIASLEQGKSSLHQPQRRNEIHFHYLFD